MIDELSRDTIILKFLQSVSGEYLTSSSCIYAEPTTSLADTMIELRAAVNFKVQVHKALLCHYSAYYRAALLGGFQEASSTYLDLKMQRADAEIFIQWLYSGRLSFRSLDLNIDDMIQLYIFADRVDIPALRRQIMTELVEKKTDSLYSTTITVTYRRITRITDALPPSAPLYNYAVNWYVNHVDHSDVDRGEQEQLYEELPKEFMHIVMRRLLLRVRSPNSDTEAPCGCCNRPCEYHEHDTKTEFYDSKFLQQFLQRYHILITSGYSVRSL
jgi:hypothetical protein